MKTFSLLFPGAYGKNNMQVLTEFMDKHGLLFPSCQIVTLPRVEQVGPNPQGIINDLVLVYQRETKIVQ